jgi:predicted enzyme related to lactoylglutathione lyase
MSLQIKEIAFVLHSVADIARARQFYETLLGLKTGREIEYAPGSWWIEYDVAGVALAVSNHGTASASAGTSVALEVGDIDGAWAAIQGAGVAVTQELVDFPACRMFGINSPDGHPMIFHQRKAQGRAS